MASLVRELAEGHEEIARMIQHFTEKKHTVKEHETFLEEIRGLCWSHYNDASEELGW